MLKNKKNIESFVIQSGLQTIATGVILNLTTAYVFQEDRNVIGMRLRVGVVPTSPIAVGAVLEAICQVTPQAAGLIEGTIMTLEDEYQGMSLVAATAGQMEWSRRDPKTETMWAPDGYAWKFEKGESINLINWVNNQTANDAFYAAYLILFYED